ncbi:aspartyl/asparaginyl beta-hydroxylase domain-containing protein [Thermaurantiacus sp.]
MASAAATDEARIREALARNPRDIGALLAMGDMKARAGDDRAATGFFRAALNQARVTPPPAALHGALRRADQWLRQASRQYEAHLLNGVGDVSGLPRVAQALDLLLGRTPLYLQQPSLFYFPGLPQRAFYERGEFPWLRAIEAMTDAMAAEARAILADGVGMRPYVETPADRPAPNNPLRDRPDWSAFFLWRGGAVEAANAARAPTMMAALEHAPIPRIARRSPMALMSVLKPGTHIQPHHGMLNTRLIVHVPLVSNPDCALRVGAETRGWVPGEALIFDDSFEHEAWNRGSETRAVLLFEIWRPEITPEERVALTRLFETIDHYGPAAAESGGDQ